MTQEQLDRIDEVLGQSTLCKVPHQEVDLLDETLRAEGFESYANLLAFKDRKKTETSLWLRRPDDTCYPELYVLAVLKHGNVLGGMRPFWKDGNPHNNSIDNVALAPSVVDKFRPGGGISKNWNDPVGRVRQREASKLSAKKRRKEIAAARASLPQTVLQDLARSTLLPDGRRGSDDDRDTTRAPKSLIDTMLEEISNEIVKERDSSGGESA